MPENPIPNPIKTVTGWFGRQFEFSFGVELLPNICARLLGTPARLEELVRGYAAEQMTAHALAQWSAQEHTGHLLDMEPLWLRRVADYANLLDQLAPADLTNRNTTAANHNAQPLEQILSDFRQARNVLLRRIGGLNSSLFSRSLPHPRLKTPMRLVDHLYFVAEHDDHHLAKIWGLVQG